MRRMRFSNARKNVNKNTPTLFSLVMADDLLPLTESRGLLKVSASNSLPSVGTTGLLEHGLDLLDIYSAPR